ncbi:DNA polymerase [Spodoptera frugiperda multiple nucleopolyhedrovirus]|uniref:DNA polymerase n=1 Tax=Spodoptera frugiperda nuclear polyhedrosis virus TaxID=10455 RepID=A1YJ82_NPVSF|nr:DNA polymerase [Spodoptera frugiperda multiple nucleopolyhedrovirus]ABM45802.1 DNA polymerase [Spodoptera frugiperda multiple nucleopolyhedrovirus]
MVAFSLLDWKCLQSKVKNFGNRQGEVIINTDDVFRITRMIYKDNYLIVFFTGHLNTGELYQFYLETKCDLYSYRMCFNTHASTTCFNKCTSYKTMVMPGLRGVHSERINIIKYKRNPSDDYNNRKSLDSFLNDINRVHTQTNLKEGKYIKFTSRQRCLNNRLQCAFSDFDSVQNMFTIVDPDSLKCEIVPVMACYDIETYSNGQQFSNANNDPIISIGLALKRSAKLLKICLYHMPPGVVDDMQPFFNENKDNADIYVCRFDTELEMIDGFFKLLPLLNMDCLLDFNGDKFDLPYIIDRVKKVNWSKDILKRCGHARAEQVIKIKRYDHEPLPIKTKALFDKFQNTMNTHFLIYYTHVDLYQFLSTDSEQNDVENFQLNTVSQHYLNSSKVDLPISTMISLYDRKEMQKILEYNVQDCVLPIDIFLKLEVMDFMYTQCELLYLSTDDVLSNISHKVNVVFFYNAINNTRYDKVKKINVPDPYFFNKHDLNVTSGRKRTFDQMNDGNVDNQMVDLTQLKRKPIPVASIPADAVRLCHQKQRCVYTGGKVLSPNPGFKKWVVTLDFNSLYLSIMMQEGICLSNVFVGQDGYVYLMKDQEAINPKLLKTLLDLRTMYKKKRDRFEPNSFVYNLYDKTQNAVKRIANSIYGYFGIFFKPLANYITKIGREKLMEAIENIEAMSDDPEILRNFNMSSIRFKVIYGDTDSCFIQVLFDENEVTGSIDKMIRDVINDYVLKKLNAGWVGYKMALENVMTSLILLKKKKYCYLNTENRLKYKGWLIKKDMPIFMRKTFRTVVDSYLMGHSVACGLKLLHDLMIEHHKNFGVDNNYSNYCFSMSYNENPTGKNKKKNKPVDVNAPPRKRPITIAKHCRELLSNSGTDFLPGNGDRIPYLLIDIQGNISQKSYPLKLFSEQNRVSWIKHVGIMCTFFNELIQIFGDRKEFEYYFRNICDVYMRNQMFDVKFPVLKTVNQKAKKFKKNCKKNNNDNDDDDDEDENDDDVEEEEEDQVVVNHTQQFSLYKSKSKLDNFSPYTKSVCIKCERDC